ncbi:phosphohydrolase [Bengtsoniella intestinalis]|uniref:phosphohydrolase n=1 Tax=Bengtsoniella intestinalis TaxID=3073143 RepID=UPI00391EEB95
MTPLVHTVYAAMNALYAGDPKRIQHYTKVHSYAAFLGREAGLSDPEQETLEIAALTHDIAIHHCEALYGHCMGKFQEKHSQEVATPFLQGLGVAPHVIARVCFLLSHHHTFVDVDSLDWRILLEADFLVNGFESQLPPESLAQAHQSVFQTPAGKTLCAQMFGLDG